MSSYSETLRYLYALQWRGMKLGLRNTRKILDLVGHPERLFPVIHVAGTNGKGSTSSFLASIAMEAGCRTGLYTSPHLLRFTERIRVNGTELSEEELVYYVRILRPAIESVHATFFEATTCVAFLYFADEGVDLAVIETGLGGRFDATNVVKPILSVITNIGLEHTEHLGTTIRAIAREKGGIIKRATPVVTASDDEEALRVFRAIAKRKHAPLIRADKAVTMKAGRQGKGTVAFAAGGMRIRAVHPDLPGHHQLLNARLAVAAWTVLKRRSALLRPLRMPSAAAIARGLARVRHNAGLRARLEFIRTDGPYYIDVAHNPAGVEALVKTLLEERIKPHAVVFGVMKDKDYRAMLSSLRALSSRIFAVAPSMDRALSASFLWKKACGLGVQATLAGTVKRGVRMARRFAGPEGTVLVTGSHYVAAAALESLEGKST